MDEFEQLEELEAKHVAVCAERDSLRAEIAKLRAELIKVQTTCQCGVGWKSSCDEEEKVLAEQEEN